MGDIVEFLRQRIAEDEAVANELDDDESGVGLEVMTATGYPCEQYLTIGKARVLRDVAAKRAIIDLHQSVPLVDGAEGTTCAACGPTADDHSVWAFPGEDWTPCDTLKILAGIWVDHPDYDPAWAVAE